MLFQILSFPFAGPLKTVAWIGGAIRDAVDSKMNDPMEIKRALAALEQQLDAGSISEQEYERMEMELIERLQASSQHAARQHQKRRLRWIHRRSSSGPWPRPAQAMPAEALSASIRAISRRSGFASATWWKSAAVTALTHAHCPPIRTSAVWAGS